MVAQEMHRGAESRGEAEKGGLLDPSGVALHILTAPPPLSRPHNENSRFRYPLSPGGAEQALPKSQTQCQQAITVDMVLNVHGKVNREIMAFA